MLDVRLRPHVIAAERVVRGKKLGTGCSGVTFAGTVDGAAVCLKTLHYLLTSVMEELDIDVGSPEHVAQLADLQNEALLLLSRRRHIALELASGGALDVWLKGVIRQRKGAGVDIWDLVSWVTDMACGLTHLHSSEECAVVHRDLKPDNCLVRENGDGSVSVLLSDLGTSKALSYRNSAARSLVGNQYTKAPEAVRGLRLGQGPHSDVYSWAITVCIVVMQTLQSCEDDELITEPMVRFREPVPELVMAALQRTRPLSDAVATLLEQCAVEDFSSRPPMADVLLRLLVERKRLLQSSAPVSAAQWMVLRERDARTRSFGRISQT